MIMDIVKQKIMQAVDILNELDIDLWLIFCRESDVMADPCLPLVIGHKVVWQSAFFICRDGDTTAMVGNYDASNFEKSRRFKYVLPYVQDCGAQIREYFEKLDPRTIAINYSEDDPSADGLSHGMYGLLCRYLEGTNLPQRFISSEKLVSLLRGRKLDEEIDRVRAAAILANNALHNALNDIAIGQTEMEIAEIIERHIARQGAVISFDLAVNAADKSEAGHGNPGTAKLAPGDLLHVDMGARLHNYCSDIQRLAYFRRVGESAAPTILIEAFNAVRDIMTEVAQLYCPGAIGHEIDAVARQRLRERGYPEYEHALGHQLGRSVHDGAAIVGPQWQRYGNTTSIPLELNNVFTVEFGIELNGIGYVGLEEDLVVTETGGRFLCPRQMELIVV